MPQMAALVVAAVVGCAQQGPGGASGGASGPCNATIVGIGAAAVGALIPRKKEGERLADAAVLGGVAALACLAYNYHVRQTRGADQVAQDYRSRTGGPLPPSPLVTSYQTTTSTAKVSPGDHVTVTSNIEIVPGQTEPLTDLHEEFHILDPAGTDRGKLTKTPAAPASAGGDYQSTLDFTFPKDIPNGPYQVQSQLFVNGRAAGNRSIKIDVAAFGASDAVRLAVATSPGGGDAPATAR